MRRKRKGEKKVTVVEIMKQKEDQNEEEGGGREVIKREGDITYHKVNHIIVSLYLCLSTVAVMKSRFKRETIESPLY